LDAVVQKFAFIGFSRNQVLLAIERAGE